MIKPFSTYATLIYGISALLLSSTPYPLVRAEWFSNIAEYWGAVTAGYLFIQYLPTGLFLRKCLASFPACHWGQDPWDMASSYWLFVALCVIPPVVTYGLLHASMLHWQHVVWVNSLAAAVVDIIISAGQGEIRKAVALAAARAPAAAAAPHP